MFREGARITWNPSNLGSQDCDEPVIFVVFEESSKRVTANAGGLGWDHAELHRKKLFFADTEPSPDLIPPGNFNLSGMFAALWAEVKEIVDVLRGLKPPLADEIFMTPTLHKLSPSPARKIVGTLSQTQPVLLALGLDNLR